jgi:urease accessory protein
MKKYVATFAAVITPTAAFAHTGNGMAHVHGVAQGFMHPITGADHVMAMFTVGLLAYVVGGRALWLVPAAFISMMAVGGALGMSGINLPFVELGIGLSIVGIGAAAAFGQNLSVSAAMALVGTFAIFHGFAHGAEMPVDASGLTYAVGFISATAMLHAAGIAVCFRVEKLAGKYGKLAARLGGGLAALAGVALVSGAF